MELLAPAGNLEKLRYVYQWGADAAYIGLGPFSLRAAADSFTLEQAPEVLRLKGSKKLYAALNMLFHESDMAKLEENLELLQAYPLDGFIISDLGLLRFLQKNFPHTELHLSTQASCLNSESIKVYGDLGFKRVILGREAPLKEIAAMKRAAPHVELEAFVHGAMCMAYSGRCFLSRWTCGQDRSANQGACTHSCRWEYRVLEEKQRPGEFFPIEQENGYTTILASKDLCMIDHLDKLAQAGIDSAKIEGRMKSIYYAALTVRAYRAALDETLGRKSPWAEEFKAEVHNVSHREFSTGFYFDDGEVQKPHDGVYQQNHQFVGSIGAYHGDGLWKLEIRNQILCGEELEFLGPETPSWTDSTYTILDHLEKPCTKADPSKDYLIKSARPLSTGFLLRKSK